MAIGPETIALVAELRAIVDDSLDIQARQLVQAWARAWDTIAGAWQTAADQAANGTATIAELASLDRAQAALAQATEQLARLLTANEVNASNVAADLAAAALQYTPLTIASQFPATEGTTSTLAVQFDRVDVTALQAIVERTTEQITSLSAPLSDAATEAMKRELVNGVAFGLSPRDAAARMLAGVEGEFNGGLARALTISRTEIVDAYRTAAGASQDANADVLQGWMWTAQLDDSTCPSCWAQDGVIFDLSEPGPLDHANGRCARTPVTKTWRDLGFDIDEPTGTRPDAQDVFAALTPEQQLAVMGPTRLAGLQDGSIAWTDLSTKRSSDSWRDSFVPTPVGQLVAA